MAIILYVTHLNKKWLVDWMYGRSRSHVEGREAAFVVTSSLFWLYYALLHRMSRSQME